MEDNHQDCFDPIDKTLIYTPENIPINELADAAEEVYYGCICLDECSTQCPCYKKSGAIFKNRILQSIDEQPVYECHDICMCENNCRLRCVQFGPMNELKVKYIDEQKGYGLFIEVDIPKDYFICEYAGELLYESEAEIRYNRYKSENKMNYIFWVKEHFGKVVKKTIIDPTVIGNIGRFINHSCEPNCYYVLVRVNSVFPKLCILSKRALNLGDEITMDYGVSEYGQQLNHPDDKKVVCACKSESCKGFLPSHVV